MADQWSFGWENKRFGPFSPARLKELVALGSLQPTDTVWKQGRERGALAGKIGNLFPDLQAQALLETANASVANEPSSPLKWCDCITGSTPNTGAKLLPLPLSTNYQGIPDEQIPECIPDGSVLRAMPGQADLAPPVFPVPINSPASEQVEDRLLESFLALPGATALKARSPALPDPNQASFQKKPVRKRRATAVKGAVITGQDGQTVRYRKKCVKCGFEDPCGGTMRIRHGVSRDHFFCPQCKKMGEVIIQGSN